jgi:hypothetical protein
MQSICLFHNGNSRILNLYKTQFKDLKFCGNLAESTEKSSTGCLWEICFSDATPSNLLDAISQGVKIVRHISTYQDDIENLLPECERFNYNDWLNNVVSNNLCFAHNIVSDLNISSADTNNTVLITTGRTANTHLQLYYKSKGRLAFEGSTHLDQDFFSSADSVFVWRLDQWACLTSNWIARCTNYSKSHQTSLQPIVTFDEPVAPLSLDWIKTEWFNRCKTAMDQSLFSKYVLNKFVSVATTEFIIKNIETIQQPLRYKKKKLIPNYDEIKCWYEQSDVATSLDIMYNQVTKHLQPWSMI